MFFVVGGSWQVLGCAGLVFVMAVINYYYYYYYLILILCFYIYILVIGNIMNKSLFM